MLLGARQFFEKRGAPTPPLPYDSEVEYLESTGTQWIDTGLPNAKNRIIEVRFQMLRTPGVAGNKPAPFYTYISRGVFLGVQIYNNYGEYQFRGGVSSSYQTLSLADLYWHQAKLDTTKPRSIWIDGSLKYSIDTEMTGNPTVQNRLFAYSANANSPTVLCVARISYYSVTDTTTEQKLQDFIPVRVGSGASAVGYMYDRVSGTLLGNAGSGAFLYGPDKS